MTRYKWINRWITADLSGLYIFAGALCVLFYGAGYLLPSPSFMTVGYAGFFLVILFALLHQQLHACDNFLSMHPATDHIPKAQMKLVNGVYLAVFLSVTGAVMAVFSLFHLDWLFEWMRSALAAVLRFLARLIPERSEEPAASAPSESFVPPVMGEEAAPPSILAKIFDVVLQAAAAVILLLLAVYLLRQFFLLLIRLFKPREDGDEKEFIKPVSIFARNEPDRMKERPLWRDFSVEGKIRRIYKKEILKRISGRARISRTETPGELEEMAGFPQEPAVCDAFHQIYEKARYGNGCKKEELERLNDIRRLNIKKAESKSQETMEE